jgi:enoyl-CoA hydratase/carnithine racemase
MVMVLGAPLVVVPVPPSAVRVPMFDVGGEPEYSAISPPSPPVSPVPPDKLEEALASMAERIMACSQHTIAAYKRLYNTNENMSLDEGQELEFRSEVEIGDTEERLKQFRK